MPWGFNSICIKYNLFIFNKQASLPRSMHMCILGDEHYPTKLSSSSQVMGKKVGTLKVLRELLKLYDQQVNYLWKPNEKLFVLQVGL